MLLRRRTPNVPPVLEKIDNAIGSNTIVAYKRALELAPHLAAVSIGTTNRGQEAHFRGHVRGLRRSTVALPVRAAYYENFIKDAYTITRMAPFETFYKERGVPVTAGTMADAIVLHELGHADRFAGLVTANYGDSKRAHREGTEAYRQQRATLPTAMGVAEAQAHGLIDKPSDIWLKSAEAYAQLTEEKGADDFALSALATLYNIDSHVTMFPAIAQPNVPRSYPEYARIMGLPPL